MRDESVPPQPGWLKIGGIGCGGLILLLLSAATLVTLTYRSYGRAPRTAAEVSGGD